MITYPLSIPTTIGIESIELRAFNSTATSESPFTYKQQVFSHGGQKWEATVNLPATLKDKMAAWKAFLLSLKGHEGTFLLSDPDYKVPQGNVSSCVLTGLVGAETVSVVMTGTLKAGDYIQLGAGASARLHQVLQDKTGDGNLEIWPSLRDNYTSVPVTFNEPAGVFRLKNSVTSWTINNSSVYGMSFEAVEAIV